MALVALGSAARAVEWALGCVEQLRELVGGGMTSPPLASSTRQQFTFDACSLPSEAHSRSCSAHKARASRCYHGNRCLPTTAPLRLPHNPRYSALTQPLACASLQDLEPGVLGTCVLVDDPSVLCPHAHRTGTPSCLPTSCARRSTPSSRCQSRARRARTPPPTMCLYEGMALRVPPLVIQPRTAAAAAGDRLQPPPAPPQGRRSRAAPQRVPMPEQAQ